MLGSHTETSSSSQSQRAEGSVNRKTSEDRLADFKKLCANIYATEKSPRSLQAYWALKFIEEFEEGKVVTG